MEKNRRKSLEEEFGPRARRIEIRYLAPLLGVEGDANKIAFPTGVVLRKASKEEIHLIKKLLGSDYEFKFGGFLLAFEGAEFEISPGTIVHDDESRNEFDRILTVIRLHEEGPAGYDAILQMKESGNVFRQFYNRDPYQTPEYTRFIKEKVQIPESSVTALLESCDKIVSCSNKLALALEYFNKSFHEPYTPRDSFLDLMITLENLYLFKESNELGYKLRMRAAAVLSSNLQERMRIIQDLKKAYGLRGKIVHGETPGDMDLNFFLKIRDYTRQSLVTFSADPDLRTRLDGLLLDSK